jgi:hypothetical protein
MGTSRRWKEERIGRLIYLDRLKISQNLSDGADLELASLERQDGSSTPFLQEQPDVASESSTVTKKDGFPWMFVRLAVLGAVAAAWFWIHAAQFGVHR